MGKSSQRSTFFHIPDRAADSGSSYITAMFPACYSKSTNGVFQKTSFTTLIVGVFVVYVLHTCWVMYGIVYTKPCDHSKGDNCIVSYMAENPRLELSIYTSLKPNADGGHSLILKVEDFDIHSSFERTINVSLPKKMRSNGTLYALVYVHQASMSPWQDSRQVNHVAQLTTYMLRKPPEVSLISGQGPPQQAAQQRSSVWEIRPKTRGLSHTGAHASPLTLWRRISPLTGRPCPAMSSAT
ncbi:hypothetical protein AAFF_G00403070 [Aldrovandia affinis]|uniref:Lipid scramblase CLPTM1L n=1 Tax=Aldrovandia affinis TaxID=143900 RepID=A0AAD7T7L6_9TELE|nr:hypothetical protein AAFF_G00403070 [Aldrovandia affinis]